MSADNGIYILKTKDSYRVKHAQAIESLFHSPLSSYGHDEIVPTRAIAIFGDCKFTRDEGKALQIAHRMAEEQCTEYGVKMFSTYKSWKRFVNEAKELAPKEIEYWRKYYANGRFDFNIKRLEIALSRY